MRWHIPHDSYSVPVEYLRGVHMLYAATQSEEYNPLTDEPMDVASMSAVVGKYEDALKAKDARISTLTGSLDDREASLVRMREMLNQSRAEIARLQADGIHSCHDGCTRSGCVNARLRVLLVQAREIVSGYRVKTHIGPPPHTLAHQADSLLDSINVLLANATLASLRAWNAETDPDVASALDDLTKSRGTT